MKAPIRHGQSVLALLLTLSLGACGGGGSSSASTDTPDTSATPSPAPPAAAPATPAPANPPATPPATPPTTPPTVPPTTPPTTPPNTPPPLPGPTNPAPAPVFSTSLIEDEATAFKFLAMAGFGGSSEDISALVGMDAADWLASEFAKPYDAYMPRIIQLVDQSASFSGPATQRRHQLDMFWDAAIAGDDPLRQRMIFALSQILVANVSDRRQAHREGYYLDVLGSNAFGNYRNLLRDITYTPLMGQYLTYVNNRRGNPATGRLPDENYAREILQLFSIGLVELDMNGEPRLAGGEPIETYDNDDVVGLARVFTGLVLDRSEPGPVAWYRPMVMNDARHSELEKRFLGTVIAPDTDGETTIAQALDAIFAHPNVAPFLARQLIQRFTASSPRPDYVERVAMAFETGRFNAANGRVFGTGARGDLEATLAAILLDPSLFDAAAVRPDDSGKVREPVLRFIHWARAFRLENVDSAQENRLNNPSSPTTGLAQRPFGSPSVFNFYRPGFVAPGTESAGRGLTAPEFQIVNSGSAIGFANFMTDYIRDNTPNNGSGTFVPNYSTELALADDAEALVDHLARLLTGNQLTTAGRVDIVAAVSSIGIRAGDEADDRRARVVLAIIMVVNAPAFTVIR